MPEPTALRMLQVISSAAASGAERHCVDISLAFMKKGHKVEAAVPPGSWLADELREGGCPVHEIDFKRKKGFQGFSSLTALVRAKGFDVIHSHLSRASTAAWVASMRTRTPLCATVHIRSKGLIYRLISRSGGRVIAVSQFIRGVLLEAGCRPDRTLVVTNGTDFAERSPGAGASFREEIGVPSQTVLGGLVGRVAREKGQHLAVEALGLLRDELPSLHLAFIGRISQEEFSQKVLQRAEELGVSDRVHMTGPRSDIPRVLDSLDFTLMPSEMEACPLSALESMARGRPVVAAKVGGLPEMVPDRHVGLQVDLSAESLAQGLREMASSSALREDLGHRSRLWVAERFSSEAMLQGLESVYREALIR